MTPKISVVTVCFNAADCIEKTILSVINQTYSNIEYIIIDGGSTDGTVDIIRKYSDHIDYWVSEPDEGIYDAMNKGITNATGEWINFMNAGDLFWDDTTLQQVINFLEQHIDTDVLYGDCGFLNSTHILPPFPFWKNKKKYQGIGFCHQATYFKLSLLKQYRFNQYFFLCADFDLCWKLYHYGKNFKYMPFPLCRFDMTGISVSIKNRQEIIKQNAEISDCRHTFGYWLALNRIKLLYLMPTSVQNLIAQFYQKIKFSKQFIAVQTL